MTCVVADSSVLISLDCGRLTQMLHAIGLDVRLSNFMVRCELRPLLKENPGLIYREETLSKHEVLELQDLRAKEVRLSVPDVSAFLVARRLKATLLTDDKRLTALSRDREVRCRGLVWCLDEFEKHGVDLGTLALGIARIQAKEPNNSRKELSSRRDRYEALADVQARSSRRASARSTGRGEQPARSASARL